ncbi:MAG: FGGY-family carbohydrate kinase [Phormidesmis sp.]
MLSLGIDFGTSGARGMVLDAAGKIVSQSSYRFLPDEVADASVWRQILWKILAAIAPQTRTHIARIAINGTSATVLVCNSASTPLSPPLLYNNAIARSVLPQIASVAPLGSPTLSATSSLAKALWWRHNLDYEVRSQVTHLLHQADWLASLLHAQPGISDYHNALKLGYDVRTLRYPDWLLDLPIADWLPAVRSPGDIIAPILPQIAKRFGLPATCQVCAGTTDSIAAFLASGAHQLGDAVTSLGSTLVLKLLSDRPIDDQSFGIYSHRLGDLWLAGGASNTGGAVLRQFFTPQQLIDLSSQIDISQPCELDYYPLTSVGERFPVNDPDYAPRLTPRPDDDRAFLYGILDAIARIEAQGYETLVRLGAPKLQQVYTAGGGAQNITWQALRQRRLGVSVTAARQTEAAYGSAQLAMKGLSDFMPKT